MRKVILTIISSLSLTLASAQTAKPVFNAYLFNIEYNVYMKINFYQESITVPGNELYGQLPGYLGKMHNSFCWPITSAKLRDENTAEISLINDYGSEDLTATLTKENDSIYILRQIKGSTLKVPLNGKWQKLPKTLPFKRRE